MVNENTKLLTICSSKSRPKRALDMIKSFIETSNPITELILYVSSDDPKLQEYQDLMEEITHERISFITGSNMTLPQVLNHFSCIIHPNTAYYSEVNDDHIYRTKDWDIIMTETADKEKNGWAIIYGETQNLPSAIMISGKIVRTLGYFFPPIFTHLYTDDWVREIGTELDLLIYLPGVKTEHMHPCFGKAGWDDTYKWVYSPERWNEGQYAISNWRQHYKLNDIEKLKRAIENDN